MANRQGHSWNRTALVTGASSGIGRELARVHARRGRDLVVVARQAEALNALKEELERTHGVSVTVVALDLSVPGAAHAIFDATERQSIRVDVLINNAGFGGHGFFHERPLESHTAMIQVNVAAVTELTRLYLPGMVERKQGRVLNLASMAGFLPGPLQAVYYATKAYVLSLTEALANELEGTGVTATALCPGPTASGFQTAGELDGVSAFKNAASAREVAEFGYAAMERGEVVAIPGTANRLAVGLLPRLLPRGLVTRISRGTMEKRT